MLQHQRVPPSREIKQNMKAGETEELFSHIFPFLFPLAKQQVKATGQSPAVLASSNAISHEIPAVRPTPPPPARSREAKQSCCIPAGSGAAQGDCPRSSVPCPHGHPRLPWGMFCAGSGSVTGEPPASGSAATETLTPAWEQQGQGCAGRVETWAWAAGCSSAASLSWRLQGGARYPQQQLSSSHGIGFGSCSLLRHPDKALLCYLKSCWCKIGFSFYPYRHSHCFHVDYKSIMTLSRIFPGPQAQLLVLTQMRTSKHQIPGIPGDEMQNCTGACIHHAQGEFQPLLQSR